MNARRKVKSFMFKVDELSADVFVRKALPDDHVLYLAELIESGVVMNTKMLVTPDGRIVDGRCRHAAYDLCGVRELTEKEIKLVVVESETDLIAMAVKANTGGSRPPTKEDNEHVVALLLDRGEGSIPKIARILGLPEGVTRKYVSQIKAKRKRVKLNKAVTSVVEGGLTVNEAADKYGLKADDVKQAIAPKRKAPRNGVAEIRAGLTSRGKSESQKNAALLRSLLEKFEDGDVTEKQVVETIEHMKRLTAQARKVVIRWEKRFKALPKP